MNEYKVEHKPVDITLEQYLNNLASYGWKLVAVYEGQFIFVREPRV